jgi:hypothetical protein
VPTTQLQPASSRADRERNVGFDLLAALGDTQVRELLDIPPTVLLKAGVNCGPPSLPSPLLSRRTVFPELARKFDSERVVSVVGYPESGKTVAISEFAASYPGEVFWFSATHSETHPESWLGLCCFSLAQFFGVSSLLTDDIRVKLRERRAPLLVVIDNAHSCHDLDALGFLFDSASSTSALSVLLVGTDEPDFVSAIRSRGIVEWRLPGLARQEAESLLQLGSTQLSHYQAAALEFLRVRVDGHLGMLRLSRQSVLNVSSSDKYAEFVSQITKTLGVGLDALQCAMIERLREALDEGQIELCRRLSVVRGAFPRRVGERLWMVDRPLSDFHKSWNACVIGVFENGPAGKYDLPDLYRDGFRKEVDRRIVGTLHSAIADGFEERDGEQIDVFDIYAVVNHRLQSGNTAVALESAAMYLALARGPHARTAQAFLIRRFEPLFANSTKDSGVSSTSRLRWLAIRARVYSDLNLDDKAGPAISDLHALLSGDSTTATAESLLLGWTTVLMHASTSGQPELALSVIGNVSEPPFSVDDAVLSWREYFVITAFLNSSESPLAYLRKAAQARTGKQTLDTLWTRMMGYDFWRAVSAAIYSRSDSGNHSRAKENVENVRLLASECRAAGENHVACLIECVLVNIQIDLLRSFEAACSTAKQIVGLLSLTSEPRVQAFVFDTLGDALRCSNQDDAAVVEYARALKTWPESAASDRAETLLMMGVSYAKASKYSDAVRAARGAAAIHLGRQHPQRTGNSRLAASRCLLEAAVFAIHGDSYAVSVRSLIDAHRLLVNEFRDGPEWVALAQVAWSLVNRIKPDPLDPQPPAPGFTLGLGESIAGSEKMLRSAPTMVLARACAAVGRPHRALFYFETSLSSSDAPDLQMQIGIMALDLAIEVKDLVAAARFALLGSRWLALAPHDAPQDRKAFVFDFLLSRTLQLASGEGVTQRNFLKIVTAVEALSPSADDRVIHLLMAGLRAYENSIATGDDVLLEKAYGLAIQCDALWIARDIAWHWCFRFSIGRPAYENQIFFWHWRLCWLAIRIGGRDGPYLDATLGQERAFWNRIPENSRSDGTSRILRVLAAARTAKEVLSELESELAELACRSFNVTDVARELSVELQLVKDASPLARPLDAFYARLLDLLLHPGATRALPTLIGDIELVIKGLDASTHRSEATETFRGLVFLARVLESGKPSAAAFDVLRRACARSRELGNASAAQLFVWLRHFVQFSTSDFGFEEIVVILMSDHVTELLTKEDLPSYLRIRLGTCQLGARSFVAQRQLSNALSIIGTQDRMQSPVSASAVTSAMLSRTSALRELTELIGEFQAIGEQASHAGLSSELWSCFFELGGMRHLVGASLLVQGNDESARDGWLRPSINDYRASLHAITPFDSPEHAELALKSACSARLIAKALADDEAILEFSRVIEEIRSLEGCDALIAQQESIESQDLLSRIGLPVDDHSYLNPGDEKAIERFTNHIMQSTGWPEDRRQFVEDDVRKMARSIQEQQEYCRHLQPLQNLLHTHSPLTIYASKTWYTCSCTSLGYETRIESDDIDAVINAMKRTYCDGCTSRSPRLNN